MNGTLRPLLELRASIMDCVRDFFAARNVLPADTPSLAPTAPTDPALQSLELDVSTLGGKRYLHTSPEHMMKRLLAAGSGDIYQIARVYRDGEIGRWHQPEFLLLEWYRSGFDEFALMDEAFDLLSQLPGDRLGSLRRLDLSYGDAFGQYLGIDPHRTDPSAAAQLAATVGARGIDVPERLSFDVLQDLALSTAIVPEWPADTVVFLYDYPATQAALAEIKPGDPPLAARFEIFLNGLELGNGFRELTDSCEQRRRFESDLLRRRAAGLPEPPVDEALLDALTQGLPPCSGLAIGLDRLIAVAAGAASLAEVILLPH